MSCHVRVSHLPMSSCTHLFTYASHIVSYHIAAIAALHFVCMMCSCAVSDSVQHPVLSVHYGRHRRRPLPVYLSSVNACADSPPRQADRRRASAVRRRGRCLRRAYVRRPQPISARADRRLQ